MVFRPSRRDLLKNPECRFSENGASAEGNCLREPSLWEQRVAGKASRAWGHRWHWETYQKNHRSFQQFHITLGSAPKYYDIRKPPPSPHRPWAHEVHNAIFKGETVGARHPKYDLSRVPANSLGRSSRKKPYVRPLKISF